jgi:hypothetical protein
MYAAAPRGGAPWRPYGNGGCHGWGVFFFPSFRLANHMSEVPQPQNHQKTNHCPTYISINNGWMGTFEVPILCVCTVGRCMCHMNEWCVYLGVDGAWWSIQKPWLNYVCGPFIVFLRKLVIHCNNTIVILVLVYIRLNIVSELQKREKL